MTKWIVFVSIFLFPSFQRQKEIIASYSAISCQCAQWKVDGERGNIYLERGNKHIQDVNKLWDGESLPFKVKVLGSFKKKKGVPMNSSTKGKLKSAKIFVYTQFEIISK